MYKGLLDYSTYSNINIYIYFFIIYLYICTNFLYISIYIIFVLISYIYIDILLETIIYEHRICRIAKIISF